MVDRTPPLISLASISAQNNSYVSERKKLVFNIEDFLSGVNVNATVFLFAYGNETWNSSWINLIYQNGSFIAPWNTSELPNNSTWIVYVNTSDMVGNWNVTKVGIFHIDNENPRILNYYPKEDQVIWGEYRIFVEAKDLYSGLNRIEVNIGDFNGSSLCEKDSCSYILNTGLLEDGNYTLNITIFDNAENFASIHVRVKIDNSNPVLSLEYTSEYLSGEVLLKLIVGNIREIRGAKVQIIQAGGFSESDLVCENFICGLYVNTKQYPDGKYTFVFKVLNEVGMETSLSKTFYFDNTPPSLIVSTPIYENNTIFLSFGGLDDFGLNENASKIEIFGEAIEVECRRIVENKRIICEKNIEKELKPGNYSIKFMIFDLANNLASEERILEVKPKIFAGASEEGKKEDVEHIKSEENGKISIPFGELEPIQIAIIFGLPIGLMLFAIPIYSLIAKKRVASIKIAAEEKLKNEIDGLVIAERFLNMSGNLMEEKEYLLNVEKIIDEISSISPIKAEFENLKKLLPEAYRVDLNKEYEERISKLEKRNVKEIKRRIELALKIKDLGEIRKVKEELKILLKELKSHIEEEIKLIEEIKRRVEGLKIER